MNMSPKRATPDFLEERQNLCQFCIFLCTEHNLTLCDRDPITGQFWPTSKRWVDLLDEFQGVTPKQLEADLAMALAGVPLAVAG
jgi:hypothetical protein